LSDAPDPENAKTPRGAVKPGWLLGAVPLLGVLELVVHLKQTGPDVVPDADWERARDVVKSELRPDDLVVFAPFWSDPLGRRGFGDVATMKREGRSDEQRFPRAWEVSIRGAREPTLATWKRVKEQKVGGVTVALLENPELVPVIDDLLDRVTPERLSVFRVVDDAREQPCAFQHGSTAGGTTVVPQGLLTPADKFVCPGGGHAGIAVLHDLGHHPRLCLYATPMPGSTLRLRFANVTFGSAIHGHSGVQWVAERTPANDKISVSFSADGHWLGAHAHRIGAGWTGFELPTQDLDGKTGELTVDVAPSAQRQLCFEATTRSKKVSR
jgi:hypothetical protein